MSASPQSPDGAGTAAAPATPHNLTAWLRSLDDRTLARLFVLRPDLALPAPADFPALAGRVSVRSSTQRCVDALDAPTLRVLEQLVLRAGDDGAVPAAPEAESPEALEGLLARALVWGTPGDLHLTAAVRDAVGAYPAGLGRPAAALFPLVPDLVMAQVLRANGLAPAAQPAAGSAVIALLQDHDWLGARLDELAEDEREVLDLLAAGPPVGTVRNTRATAGETDVSVARRLLERGLLVPIDTQRVELPREVGLALRERAGADATREAPSIATVDRGPAELDRTGTTAVLDLLRLVDGLADSWTAQSPPALRSGGLGVRELKRTAKDLGTDEAGAAFVAELAHAAGLLNTTNGQQPGFLPTPEYDAWRRKDPAARWIAVASAWLAMTRQPSLVGQRGDRDRVITALGPDTERGTVPALRRQVLGVLSDLAPGSAPAERDDVLRLLAWRQPRRASGQRAAVEAILAEADLLGLTAAGGLTGYGRTLLAGSVAAAEHALDNAMPAPVDHFLVQPDLTIVVPGPPEADLGAELALIADLESTGGASVYRITERSVRRALDAGRSGPQLEAFVASRSRTALPQALTYLIDDAARRHGVLRVGVAAAYLRCDDAALMARVLADRGVAPAGLRLIAPTIAITESSVGRVLDLLREAGFAPAAETPDGALITLGVEPPRAPSRPPARGTTVRRVGDSEVQLAEVVRRLRSADALAGLDHRVHPVAREIPGVTSAATMELLRAAVREARLVWLGYAGPDGSTTAHTIQPISLAAGTVRGYERGRSGLSSFPVHRITAIRVLEDADDAEDLGDAEDLADAGGDDGPGPAPSGSLGTSKP